MVGKNYSLFNNYIWKFSLYRKRSVQTQLRILSKISAYDPIMIVQNIYIHPNPHGDCVAKVSGIPWDDKVPSAAMDAFFVVGQLDLTCRCRCIDQAIAVDVVVSSVDLIAQMMMTIPRGEGGWHWKWTFLSIKGVSSTMEVDKVWMVDFHLDGEWIFKKLTS